MDDGRGSFEGHYRGTNKDRTVEIVSDRRGHTGHRNAHDRMAHRRRSTSPDVPRQKKRKSPDGRFETPKRHRRHSANRSSISQRTGYTDISRGVRDSDARQSVGEGGSNVPIQKVSWIDNDRVENSQFKSNTPHQEGSSMSPSDNSSEIHNRRVKRGDIKQRLGKRVNPSEQDNISTHDRHCGREEVTEMTSQMSHIEEHSCDDFEYEELAEFSDELTFSRTSDYSKDLEDYRNLQRDPYYKDYEPRLDFRNDVQNIKFQVQSVISNIRTYVDYQESVPDGYQNPDIITENTLKRSSKDKRENVASTILTFICDIFDGSSDLKSLNSKLLSYKITNFSDSRSLCQFLKEYDEVFEIEGEGGDQNDVEEGEVGDTSMDDFKVTAKPNLQLCIAHSTKAGSCTDGCSSLHICKYYIMSKCDIYETSGIRCLFGHDMTTEHNKYVMRKSLIHKVRKDILLKLKYRNSTTLPVICKFYNSPRGCFKQNECQFLHICSKYITGTCRSPQLCDLSHDITSDQAYPILCRYGMAPENETMVEEVVKTLSKIEIGQNFPTPVVKAGKEEEGRSSKKSTESDISTVSTLETINDDDVGKSSSWDWRWAWQTEDGKWTDVHDSHQFEEKFREFILAKKMQFSINNKLSEINFATMTGRIKGESPLKFQRVRKEKFERKS